MLTKLTIRNFKRFGEVEIELGNPVVFIGPNNSGKTSALQAIALWDIGLKRWNEKRRDKPTPEKRPGVTINRRDLVAVPIPTADQLWRDLHVRDVKHVKGKPQTGNVRIDVIAEGVSGGKCWSCGFEFDYANAESIYCRPLRMNGKTTAERMPVPAEASTVNVAFLPPMSGLADREFAKQPGEISFLIGQGRTAEVLRNLCRQIAGAPNGRELWEKLVFRIKELFGVSLDEPIYIPERAEILMTYRDVTDVRLDLSASGRGLQQTLLLLAFLSLNPRSVLLLDEPDAHLEILRQRQIYQILTEAAREQESQIVAASHSEVILNEAADRDVVVAFVGKPHRIDDRGQQLVKSLKEIGFEQYYQAEQTGWVLYLEGSTDLQMMRGFADKLNHRAKACLERPFVHYILNQPQKARDHFRALREAKKDLVGFVLCDRISPAKIQPTAELGEVAWTKCEIENYLCQRETLLAFAKAHYLDLAGPLFEAAESEKREEAMRKCVEDLVPPAALRDPSHRWWNETKMSDLFLDPLFEDYYKTLGLPNLMRKSNYHLLARYVPADKIDAEVGEVLDAITAVADKAKPVTA